jgi:hypothetical protein
MKALGFLAPNQVLSHLDEPAVRSAQARLKSSMNAKQRERFFPEVETFSDMKKNVANFDAKKQPFACGQFVYRDVQPGAFAKGSDIKRGEVFIITKIEKSLNITRYYLMNLNKVAQTGSYYGASLRHVPEKAHPTEETSFRIKNVIKFGMHQGVPSALVQWENYGNLPIIL